MTTESVIETVEVEAPFKPDDIKKQQPPDCILLSDGLPLGSPYSPISTTPISTTTATAVIATSPVCEVIELFEEEVGSTEEQHSTADEKEDTLQEVDKFCESAESKIESSHEEGNEEGSDKMQQKQQQLLPIKEALSPTEPKDEHHVSVIEAFENNSSASSNYHEATDSIPSITGDFLAYDVTTTIEAHSDSQKRSVMLVQTSDNTVLTVEKSAMTTAITTAPSPTQATVNEVTSPASTKTAPPLMNRNFMSETLKNDFLQLTDFCKGIEERLGALPAIASPSTLHGVEHEERSMSTQEDLANHARVSSTNGIFTEGQKRVSKPKPLTRKITSIFKIFKRKKKVNLEERRSILERTYQEVYSDGGPYDDFLSSKYGTSVSQSSPNGSGNGFSMTDGTTSVNNQEGKEEESNYADKEAPIYQRFIATAILYNLSKTEPSVPYMRPQAGSKTHQFEEYCDNIFFGQPAH